MSTKNKEFFIEPTNKNNPVLVQVLGICSALAVTSQLAPSIVMALSVIVVVTLSNVIISILRKGIPSRIRIIVELVVCAGLVTIVNEVLAAFAYEVSKQLSVYVGLIITNCILMGRLEAFALSHRPGEALIDGLGNGIGYGLVLIIVGFFRELFGNGSLLGYQIIPDSWYEAGYLNFGLMNMPSMALFLLACIVWIHRSRYKDLQEEN